MEPIILIRSILPVHSCPTCLINHHHHINTNKMWNFSFNFNYISIVHFSTNLTIKFIFEAIISDTTDPSILLRDLKIVFPVSFTSIPVHPLNDQTSGTSLSESVKLSCIFPRFYIFKLNSSLFFSKSICFSDCQ